MNATVTVTAMDEYDIERQLGTGIVPPPSATRLDHCAALVVTVTWQTSARACSLTCSETSRPPMCRYIGVGQFIFEH
jgi:hypothetical protein